MVAQTHMFIFTATCFTQKLTIIRLVIQLKEVENVM
jgi:hypothetical protein